MRSNRGESSSDVDGRGIWKAEKASTRGKGGGEAGRGHPHSNKDPTVPATSRGLYPTGQQVTSFNLVCTSWAHILLTAQQLISAHRGGSSELLS